MIDLKEFSCKPFNIRVFTGNPFIIINLAPLGAMPSNQRYFTLVGGH